MYHKNMNIKGARNKGWIQARMSAQLLTMVLDETLKKVSKMKPLIVGYWRKQGVKQIELQCRRRYGVNS